jgi:hypothetical protein
LVVNLRAEADPDLLKQEVTGALESLPSLTAQLQVIAAFRPGRPNPTHRLAAPGDAP